MQTTEHIELALCIDCTTMAANGEDTHPDGEPEPLSKIDDGWIVVITCNGHDCGGFSWSPCDGCGSRLGGQRHDAVMFQIIPTITEEISHAV